MPPGCAHLQQDRSQLDSLISDRAVSAGSRAKSSNHIVFVSAFRFDYSRATAPSTPAPTRPHPAATTPALPLDPVALAAAPVEEAEPVVEDSACPPCPTLSFAKT